MEITKPKVNVWGEVPLDLMNTLKWIELAGRTCYNSLDRIHRGTACKFVNNIFKNTPPHMSVCEHSNLVLRSLDSAKDPMFMKTRAKGMNDSNFIFTGIQHDFVYIYGNWRAFFEEHNNVDFFSFPDVIEDFYPGYELVTVPGEVPYFAQAATVCFTTDRAVTHEMVRHRPCAFSQRSQRYCSESNLRIIKPIWFDKAEKDVKKRFLVSCMQAEDNYRFLRQEGYKAQDARVVLPNCTETVIVVTAYLPEWDWIYYLRTSPAAYPAIRNLMNEAKEKMIDLQLIDEE